MYQNPIFKYPSGHIKSETSKKNWQIQAISGLSKVAGCPRKLLPNWLELAGYSAWRFLNEISLDWPLTLTTQPSTSKLSDNRGYTLYRRQLRGKNSEDSKTTGQT